MQSARVGVIDKLAAQGALQMLKEVLRSAKEQFDAFFPKELIEAGLLKLPQERGNGFLERGIGLNIKWSSNPLDREVTIYTYQPEKTPNNPEQPFKKFIFFLEDTPLDVCRVEVWEGDVLEEVFIREDSKDKSQPGMAQALRDIIQGLGFDEFTDWSLDWIERDNTKLISFEKEDKLVYQYGKDMRLLRKAIGQVLIKEARRARKKEGTKSGEDC